MKDIVYLREEPMAPTSWPLARIMKVHSGQDGRVCVVTVRTSKGVYKPTSSKVDTLSAGTGTEVKTVRFWPAAC